MRRILRYFVCHDAESQRSYFSRRTLSGILYMLLMDGALVWSGGRLDTTCLVAVKTVHASSAHLASHVAKSGVSKDKTTGTE